MYQLLWCYNGCPDKTEGEPVATMEQAKDKLIQTRHKHRDEMRRLPKLDLEILDLTTGRICSYVLTAADYERNGFRR